MAAGKVHHWKHGWIPLDAYARAVVARKRTEKVTTDIHPPAEALKRAKARQARWTHLQESQGPLTSSDGITSQRIGGFRVTKVDGYPEVRFREVVDFAPRPPEQYREVAKVAQDVLKPYPRAAADPLEISFSPELPGTVMADTGIGEPHRVRVSTRMWDEPGETMAALTDMKTRHWGVFAEANDLESFRRDVITHEIGHVLHNRDEDENKYNGVFTTTTISKGEIDQFTDEAVTPRQAGFTSAAAQVRKPGTAPPTSPLDVPKARWQVDTLGQKSAYATTNKYEYFAEAFLDGTINGSKATDSGKRAVALVGKIFGPGSEKPQ